MSSSSGPILVHAAALTDLGLVRKNNEDNFLVADLTAQVTTPEPAAFKHSVGVNGSMFLVADGMGGANAGEIASQMAVDLVVQEVLHELVKRRRPPTQHDFLSILKRAIENANLAILHESRKRSDRKGMGTTLTAAAIHGGMIFFAQLGDSRAYLVRNGSIVQTTHDQSLVAQLVAAGSITPAEAKVHPQRNVILQALGVQNHIDIVFSSADLKRGDCVVLCSDGLSGKVEAEEVRQLLEQSPEAAENCERLIALARQRGGEDNITAIVVRVDGDGLPVPEHGEFPDYQKLQINSLKRRRFWPWGRG
ncbi:MAG TPA: Stp1/IreP family PP2C-type Ser/Thr phosphatase [Terriglobales bacterium]|nr:Stp1/IreP family PP2C-type Ser/Thr phosphatase [Terriglobales bacterium]